MLKVQPRLLDLSLVKAGGRIFLSVVSYVVRDKRKN